MINTNQVQQTAWDGSNKPKEVDDDYSKYINKNIDLKFFVDGAQKQGLLKSTKDADGNLKMGENSYTNAFNQDVTGWEKNWVSGMNKMHGTSHTDLGQFNKSQIGQYHYENFGKDEGRKFSPQNHVSPTPTPAPTPNPAPTPDPGSGKPAPTPDPGSGSPAPTPSPAPSTGQPGSPASEAKDRAQQFQAQSSNVTGNNNYVYQNQDNSVRHYGGNSKTFNYTPTGGTNDTPATQATLAGFYSPDDSPAAQAASFDFHSTLNKDAQKKYKNTSHIAQAAIAGAQNNSFIDPGALDDRVSDRSEYHKANSILKGGQIFGDLFGMSGPTWKSSKPADPVQKPDFDKMYDKYTDF